MAGEGRQTRWLAEDRGEPIGSSVLGHFTWCIDPGIQGVGVRVVPSQRGRGVGRALHDVMLAKAATEAVHLLVGFVDSREKRSREFAAAAGYGMVGQDFESRIEPAAADLDQFGEVVAAVQRSGITIDTLADLRRTVPDWVDRTADLYAAVEADVPALVPTAPPSREVFVAEAIEGEMVLLEAFFIARVDARWIGLTEIRRSQEAGRYDQDLTGVLPEYRRKGVATALKVRSLRWAREVGASRVRTWNSSLNQGMLAVNDLLGFERSHSIDEYHRPMTR